MADGTTVTSVTSTSTATKGRVINSARHNHWGHRLTKWARRGCFHGRIVSSPVCRRAP